MTWLVINAFQIDGQITACLAKYVDFVASHAFAELGDNQ
jgi:hypothetical protein